MMASDLAKRGCGKVLLLHSKVGKGDYRGAWEVSYSMRQKVILLTSSAPYARPRL